MMLSFLKSKENSKKVKNSKHSVKHGMDLKEETNASWVVGTRLGMADHDEHS